MEETAVWRPLVKAFLWPLLFFGTCDDETLDPVIALKQIENIAFVLDCLDPIQKRSVTLVLEQIASEVQDVKVKALILDLPKDFGWIDEEE